MIGYSLLEDSQHLKGSATPEQEHPGLDEQQRDNPDDSPLVHHLLLPSFFSLVPTLDTLETVWVPASIPIRVAKYPTN